MSSGEDTDSVVYDETSVLRKDFAAVVVGGKEFHVSIHFLSSIGGYFHSAMRWREMTEARERRFVFPDKDPREWELVMTIAWSWLQRGIEAQIIRENWQVLLPWFDELCIPFGLEACDRVLLDVMESKSVDWHRCADDPTSLSVNREAVEWLPMAIGHGLTRSKSRAYNFLVQLLGLVPSALWPKDWATIWMLLCEYEDCRLELWEAVAANLPSQLQLAGVTRAELLVTGREMLPQILFLQVQQKASEKDTSQMFERQDAMPTMGTLGHLLAALHFKIDQQRETFWGVDGKDDLRFFDHATKIHDHDINKKQCDSSWSKTFCRDG